MRAVLGGRVERCVLSLRDRVEENEKAGQTSFNRSAAQRLRECAGLLRQQQANPFRVNAYVRAAETLESLSEDARGILRRQGTAGLMQLPFIGAGLAAAIDEMARTGGLAQLNRLRGAAEPEQLFRTLPGIGPALARRIHEDLNVDSLEALEVAAYDGRLEAVAGIGPRRVDALRASLASRLGRAGNARRRESLSPGIDVLLDVDREYRNKAEAGRLPKVAPRRFNLSREAWLPILHTERDGWHFTALFSNTAKAHELGRTHDWVVVYFYDGDHREGQNTVVTETHGPLKERRVVRGREAQCKQFYGL